MTAIEVFFYLFSALAIVSAGMVILSKNPVHAVLFLVLTFVSVAPLWMLIESEFLSIVLVLVYVGAVMVLFLFVVMMLDIEGVERRETYPRYWWAGLIVAVGMVMLLEIGTAQYFKTQFQALPPSLFENNVKAIGQLLYADYLLPFEIAGVLLLAAMVSAIGLTFRGARGVKSQQIAAQVRVTKQERLSVLSMPSEPNEENAL